jgi:type VI secretion system secreted protein Hcp
MAFHSFIAVKGAKQGQFESEATQSSRKDKWMPVVSFTMGVRSPHDPATGQASGKRQVEPVTIVKEWGAASPQGLTASATNERLTEVQIEFTKNKPSGEEYVHQTVKLTDALIAQVARFAGNPDTTWGTSPATPLELERWSFTFRKIEIHDADGNTTYADDRSNPA